MRSDPAEQAAAAALESMRAGRGAAELSDLEPRVLRQALRILADYDRDIVVRIAADVIERQAPAIRHGATVLPLIARRPG